MFNIVIESGSPVMSPTTETGSVSSESDISQSDPISIGKVLGVGFVMRNLS